MIIATPDLTFGDMASLIFSNDIYQKIQVAGFVFFFFSEICQLDKKFVCKYLSFITVKRHTVEYEVDGSLQLLSRQLIIFIHTHFVFYRGQNTWSHFINNQNTLLKVISLFTSTFAHNYDIIWPVSVLFCSDPVSNRTEKLTFY